MERHDSLELVQKIRDICQRAAAEGKTTVRPVTLNRIDRHIRRLSRACRARQGELFAVSAG